MTLPPVQMQPPVLAPAGGPDERFYQSTGWRLAALAIWIGLACLLVVIVLVAGWLTSPAAFGWAGVQVVLAQMLPLALMMPAMVMIVAAGGVDLSVGAVAALAGVLIALLVESSGLHYGLAVTVALLAAGGVGLVNGALVGAARVPGVIVTLGMMAAIRGLAYTVSQERVVYVSRGAMGGVPASTWAFWAIFAVVLLGGIALVQLTPFGRRPAPGADERRESAVARAFYVGCPYVLSSVMAALAGAAWVARMQVGEASLGMGYELEVLLAVTVGGTCLGGRFGTVLGGMVGVLFVGFLRHLLVVGGLSSGFMQLTMGSGLLVTAVMLRVYYWLVERMYRSSRARRPGVATMGTA
jgi:ribose transport system permease protein